MGAFLQSETLSAPWLLRVSWEELATLIICLGLDVVELVAPVFLTPIVGDFFDVVGLLFAAVCFRWFAAISLLELLPGLDAVPLFTLTWASWYTYRRHRMRKTLEKELEKWR